MSNVSTILKQLGITAILAIFLTSCAIVQGKSTPTRYSQDAAATATIKSKMIASDMVSAPTIHVETQNGVVQLSGFVSNHAQVREAVRIARHTSGVHAVVNDLMVAPAKY